MARNRSFLLFVPAVAAAVLLFGADPERQGFFPPCPFYLLTHFHCPGCGSQRALHDLLHGRLLEAAGHNLLLVTFLPVLGWAALGEGLARARKKYRAAPLFQSAWFPRIVLVVVLLFVLLRNLPLEPFRRLAP